MSKRRKVVLKQGTQTKTRENDMEKTEKIRGKIRGKIRQTWELAGKTKRLTLFLG